MINRVMPHGSFYGPIEAQWAVAGFDVSVRSADPHRSVVRHTHEHAHFVLILDGLYVTAASGAPAFATGPTLIYNPPQVTHRDRFEHDGARFRGRFMTVTIPDEYGVEAGARVIGGASTERVLELVHACRGANAERSLAIESLLMELLAGVGGQDREEQRLPVWLRRSLQRLGDVGDTVSIASLAADAGVHPVHFARTFRRFFGTTPAAYMRDRRVERAIGLLRHTSRSLSAIAASCGFVDQSHLTHAVRRVSGTTPMKVRTGGSSSPQ
ncbi:MAG: helix-turn-helix transcriptional regulator [Gemmatimonadales bacterium]